VAVLRRAAACAAAIIVLTGLAAPGLRAAAAAAGQALTEAQAKAGFLYNCAMFVAWPAAASSRDEVVIGVLGDDAVSAIVADMQGQKVNGRTLRVLPVSSLDRLDGFHILFVAGDNARANRDLVARIGSAPILTVGETDNFTAAGGVVRLFTDQGRLRFEINMTRAEGAGLRVSAKMLGLARIVR
jgi:hypothetical protein